MTEKPFSPPAKCAESLKIENPLPFRYEFLFFESWGRQPLDYLFSQKAKGLTVSKLQFRDETKDYLVFPWKHIASLWKLEQDVQLASSWTVVIDRAVLRCASRTCNVLFCKSEIWSKGVWTEDPDPFAPAIVGPRGAVSMGGVSVAKSEAPNLRSIPLLTDEQPSMSFV